MRHYWRQSEIWDRVGRLCWGMRDPTFGHDQVQGWSAIEYAAHSRDITALHVFGVQQALTQDEPTYPPIESDELIETAAATYGDADPDVVEPNWGTKHPN
jgi:hypothetical protein